MGTPLLGFGNAPFGNSIFGWGQPATTDKRPENLVVARWINPDTNDLEILADGTFAGMPAVRQRVLLLLRTSLGSAKADGSRTLGSTIREIKRIDETTQRKVQVAVRTALHQLIAVEKLINLDSVQVNAVSPAGRLEVVISYTDLTSQDEDNVNLIL